MQVRSFVLVLLVLPLLPAGVVRAAEEGSAAEWKGYLYRDAEGRTLLGWPVVAKGVVATPAHVVAGDLAKRLAPLVGDLHESYVFWNYELAGWREGELPPLPRALVRLRGKVVAEEDVEVRMTEGKLVAVEFVSPEWLKAWAPLFRSPLFSMKDVPGRTGSAGDAERRRFAPKALAILRAMRKAAGPTKEQRALARKIDPDAKVVSVFRRGQEITLLRWLVETNEELGLGLGDLEEEFGVLPPPPDEVQRRFLAAKTRAAFLEQVRARWNVGLEDLVVAYYVKSGNATRYATTNAAVVRDEWTDEEYARHRAATKEMLGR